MTPSAYKDDPMISIITKYHGPTNTRGSRISAKRSDHQPGDPTASVPYPRGFGLNRAACHFQAVKKLAAKFDWGGEMISADTAGGYIFVFTQHADVHTLPAVSR